VRDRISGEGPTPRPTPSVGADTPTILVRFIGTDDGPVAEVHWQTHARNSVARCCLTSTHVDGGIIYSIICRILT
jgi:hypothetical protein